MSITTRVDPLTIEDLYGHLLAHEIRLEQNQASIDLSTAGANFASRNYTQRCGRGGRSSFNQSGRGNFSNNSCSKNYRGRGHGQNSPLSSNFSCPMCQVCNKPGHVALTCYHHFDNSYQLANPTTMQAYFASPLA
jgi:hypothetical protein